MKKFYESIELEITEFSVNEDLLNVSGTTFNSELDGDTTTIPTDW